MSDHQASRQVIMAGLFEATVGHPIHRFMRMPGTASVLMLAVAAELALGRLG